MDASVHEHLRARSRAWRWLACCAVLCAFDCAAAGEAPSMCEFETPPQHPMADRKGTIASLERMPETCLKRRVLECSDDANRQLMDLDSAAICSMSYEALLRKTFGGNFHALMDWWRRERTPESAP